MKILFVCSGNIFRSMSAEYCLKDYISKNNIVGVEVSSAGIKANPQPIDVKVNGTLISLGINPSGHKQRKLTKEMIEKNDLIVAMGENHRQFIEENYEKDVPLFLEICYGLKVGLKDNNEAIPDWQIHLDSFERYNIAMVKFIYKSIPLFFKNMKKFV